MGEPIGEQESLILVEAAVVEDEQELATLTPKSLDRVRDAGRERTIPRALSRCQI